MTQNAWYKKATTDPDRKTLVIASVDIGNRGEGGGGGGGGGEDGGGDDGGDSDGGEEGKLAGFNPSSSG